MTSFLNNLPLKSIYFPFQYLNQAASEVKTSKDSTRSMILERHMESLNLELSEVPTTIPLSVGSRVAGVDVQNCSYFSSATVPLRLSFKSDASTDPTLESPSLIPAIYKVGDDLRQGKNSSSFQQQMALVLRPFQFLTKNTITRLSEVNFL